MLLEGTNHFNVGQLAAVHTQNTGTKAVLFHISRDFGRAHALRTETRLGQQCHNTCVYGGGLVPDKVY